MTDLAYLVEREIIAEISRRMKLPKAKRGDIKELKNARNRMARARRSKLDSPSA